MEHGLLDRVRRVLRCLGRRHHNRRFAYTDATIVEVYLWVVINDRPTRRACQPENWRGLTLPPGLPSPSQMSRRLRTRSARRLVDRLEHRVLRWGRRPMLACAIDGHAMAIAPHSTDTQAGYGRACGGMGKGYKLHLLIDLSGTIWSWRVGRMNTDDRTMARRMVPEMPPTAYLLADSNYNTSRLFKCVRLRGAQLLTPRKQRTPNQGLGNHRQDPGWLRSIELLERSTSCSAGNCCGCVSGSRASSARW